MQKLWLFFIEFLDPTFYAKVMAILPGHKVFYKKIKKLCLLFFLITTSRNITRSQFDYFLFLSFSFIFHKTEKATHWGLGDFQICLPVSHGACALRVKPTYP
jgi:hypothetical protein